jgi:hypothetical protein
MAAPRSSSGARSKSGTSKNRKRFTLAQANSALPLVGRVAADIVAAHTRARELHAKLESRVPPKERGGVEQELESTLARLQRLVDELAEIGCELKDYRTGLVDFVGRHENRDVYLCWKLGEDKIEFWHELDAGFVGRRPVSELVEPAE